MGWFDEGGGGSPVDVAAMFDGKAWEMVTELVSAGALISVGLTSDGGALGLTVTVDGAWRREYFREATSLVLWLEEAMGPGLDGCRAQGGLLRTAWTDTEHERALEGSQRSRNASPGSPCPGTLREALAARQRTVPRVPVTDHAVVSPLGGTLGRRRGPSSGV